MLPVKGIKKTIQAGHRIFKYVAFNLNFGIFKFFWMVYLQGGKP